MERTVIIEGGESVEERMKSKERVKQLVDEILDGGGSLSVVGILKNKEGKLEEVGACISRGEHTVHLGSSLIRMVTQIMKANQTIEKKRGEES